MVQFLSDERDVHGLSAYLIAFMLSFDEYAIASFIAGDVTTNPCTSRPGLDQDRLPQMIAISVIVLLASLVVVVGVEAWRRRAERRLEIGVPSGQGARPGSDLRPIASEPRS